MGFNQSNGSNITYCQVADGKIVVRVKENTPGSVTRVTKTGKTVHELIYGSVEGRIFDIKKKHTTEPYDITSWNIFLRDDDGATICLSMNYSSRYANSFFRALPNVDFDLPVTINPWMKEIEGKKKTAIYLNQMGNKVEWYFTRENPRDLPDMQQITVRGQLQWDDTEMNQYFEQMVEDTILPAIKASTVPLPAESGRAAVAGAAGPDEHSAAPSAPAPASSVHQTDHTCPQPEYAGNDEAEDDIPF